MKFALAFVALIFCSCETKRFDSDKRQIIAKNEVRKSLGQHSSNFDVVSFAEDTLHNYSELSIADPLRYTLHFTYSDSAGAAQHKTAYILFAAGGTSVLSTQIINQP